MPELPEIHNYATHVNRRCSNLLFNRVSQSEVADRKQKHNIVSVLKERNTHQLPYRLTAHSRGKEMCLCIQFSTTQENNLNNVEEKDLKPIFILFRFGMSGRMVFTKSDQLLKHSHLTFYSKDEKFALSFVDQRQFGRYSVVSPDSKYSNDRSPDPVFEFVPFVDHLEKNLKQKKKVFEKPICEILLDQKYFNGIGNYLRAEILHRSNIQPFESAFNILNQAIQELNMKHYKCHQSNNVIQLCHDVCQEVIDLDIEFKTSKRNDYTRFKEWLTVYNKADCSTDRKGRKIWFFNNDSTQRKSKNTPGTKRKRTEQLLLDNDSDDSDDFIEIDYGSNLKPNEQNIIAQHRYPLRKRQKI